MDAFCYKDSIFKKFQRATKISYTEVWKSDIF